MKPSTESKVMPTWGTRTEQTETQRIQPCCQACAKPYAEAQAIHPRASGAESWVCEQCADEQAQNHVFAPEANRAANPDRESMTNAGFAERGAITLCDYSGACNPDDGNMAELIADLGHFADREGHNLRGVIRRAIRHWEAER